MAQEQIKVSSSEVQVQTPDETTRPVVLALAAHGFGGFLCIFSHTVQLVGS